MWHTNAYFHIFGCVLPDGASKRFNQLLPRKRSGYRRGPSPAWCMAKSPVVYVQLGVRNLTLCPAYVLASLCAGEGGRGRHIPRTITRPGGWPHYKDRVVKEYASFPFKIVNHRQNQLHLHLHNRYSHSPFFLLLFIYLPTARPPPVLHFFLFLHAPPPPSLPSRQIGQFISSGCYLEG